MPDLLGERVAPVATEALVALLDRAFVEDPFLPYLVPDPRRRPEALRRLHAAGLHYAQTYGVVECASDAAGVALWLPPGHEHLRPWGMLRAGFVGFGLGLGTGLGRLLHADEVMTSLHKRFAPEPHWYLFFLGVDPQAQGSGVGTTLLAQGQARAAQQGMPIYLETMQERNVGFYTRRGFVVQAERTLTPDLTIWSLRWDAPSQTEQNPAVGSI